MSNWSYGDKLSLANSLQQVVDSKYFLVDEQLPDDVKEVVEWAIEALRQVDREDLGRE